jgi:hypothetical protein
VADDDGTYNYTEIEGETDVLNVTDTPVPDHAMQFAVIALVAKGVAATTERLAHVIRQSSGTLTYGPVITPTSSYLAYRHAVQALPDGDPFSPGEGELANEKAVDFNAAQYGYTWPVEESEALLVAMASEFPTLSPGRRVDRRPRGTQGSVGPF